MTTIIEIFRISSQHFHNNHLFRTHERARPVELSHTEPQVFRFFSGFGDPSGQLFRVFRATYATGSFQKLFDFH
jgi:hypothetical protein